MNHEYQNIPIEDLHGKNSPAESEVLYKQSEQTDVRQRGN